MGRRIFTEPGVNTAPASETSVRSSGSVKMMQQNLIWMGGFFVVFRGFFVNASIKCCFLLFQETMFSTT